MADRTQQLLKQKTSAAFTLIEVLIAVAIMGMLFYFAANLAINFFRNQRASEFREAAFRDAQLVRQHTDICRSVLQAFATVSAGTYAARVDLPNRRLVNTVDPANPQLTSTEADAIGYFGLLKKDGTPVRTLDYEIRGLKRLEGTQLSFTYEMRHIWLAANNPGEQIYGAFPGYWGNQFGIFTDTREGINLFINGICDNPI